MLGLSVLTATSTLPCQEPFPHLPKVTLSQFFDQRNLRSRNFPLISRRVFQCVASTIPRLWFGTWLSQLAAQAFTESLITLHQFWKRIECLPRRDEITSIIIQRFYFVVFDMVTTFLIPILDAESKSARVSARFREPKTSLVDLCELVNTLQLRDGWFDQKTTLKDLKMKIDYPFLK